MGAAGHRIDLPAGQIAQRVLDDPVLQAVVGDDDEPALGLQEVNRFPDEVLQARQLLVDGDAQGLELFALAAALAVVVAPFGVSTPAQERFSFFQASTPESVQRMLTLAELKDDDVVVDLGSGDGLIPLTAARMNPRLRGFGVDIDAKLVERSNERARVEGVADRVRFEVKTTMGGEGARTVPTSGMVTWKSERISRRKASNGSSVRSISSTRRTGGPEASGSRARSKGRLRRKRSAKMSWATRSLASAPTWPASSARRISSI